MSTMGKRQEPGWEATENRVAGGLSLWLGTLHRDTKQLKGQASRGLGKSIPGRGNSENKALSSGGDYEYWLIHNYTKQQTSGSV